LTTLALYEDVLAPGAKRSLAGCNRVVYVATGEASGVRADEAWFGAQDVELEAGDEGATVLRWELTDWEPSEGTKLAAHLDLDPWAEHLLRCDRVDFPPGGIAYRHTHPGSGIRCLLGGSIRIQGEDGLDETYGPLDAWFESAGHAVLATASDSEPTAFVRVMVLPRDWEGKRTIRYLDPADEERPKLQQARVFLEAPVSL